MGLTFLSLLRGEVPSFPRNHEKVVSFLEFVRQNCRDKEKNPDGFMPLHEAVEFYFAGSDSKNKRVMFFAALKPLFDYGVLVLKEVHSEKSGKLVQEKPERIRLDFVQMKAHAQTLAQSTEEFVTRG